MKARSFLFLLLLIFDARQSKSAPIEPNSTPIVATPTETQVSPFKRKWVNSYNSSLHKSDDPRKRASFSSSVSVAYKTSDLFWVQGGIGFTQITAPLQDFNLVNPDFRGFYRIADQLKLPFKIEIGPTTSFALSEETRKQSLYFSLGMAARFSLNFQTLDSVGFRGYYDLGFNRNVHQYETATNGDVNTMSTLNHYVYAEYDIEGPFQFDVWVGFSSSWSYQGKVSNGFTLGQEVSYELTDWLDLSITHERGGDFLSTSGQTYNFGLFDSNESRYGMSATLYF